MAGPDAGLQSLQSIEQWTACAGRAASVSRQGEKGSKTTTCCTGSNHFEDSRQSALAQETESFERATGRRRQLSRRYRQGRFASESLDVMIAT